MVVLGLAYASVIMSSQPRVDGERLDLTTFVDLVERDRVTRATILDFDAYVVGTYVSARDGQPVEFATPVPKESPDTMVDLLIRARVPTFVDQQNGKRAAELAAFLLPAVIVVVIFGYLAVSYRRGTGLFGTRSGARRIEGSPDPATFADVAGQEEAVAELRDVARFLADPQQYRAVGAVAPRGVLLFGPPGCGKTLLARAVAGEAGVPFFSISGGEFVELYQGVGAARVRNLFREAREAAPAIVFVDEIDGIGRSRATLGGMGVGSQGEQEQALTQLLAEMDGVGPADGIVVLGATNRPDVLDLALLRPGRFDRVVAVDRPDETARLAILRLHAQGKALAPGADLARLAADAHGFTGAELAQVLNDAALRAAREGRAEVTDDDMRGALARAQDAPEQQRRLSLRDRSIGRRRPERQVTFADVAGADGAVAELADVRDFLADPARFRAIGAAPPRGILLSGPPGCGKTLLARALAGEARATFISAAGSEFVFVLKGLGAGRVRDLFAEARALAPSIVFIDEIDAVGARRAANPFDSDREGDQTLNQILVELDGTSALDAVTVIAATNRPDLLDPALVRPGRFDRHVAVTLPDRGGREAILSLAARDRPLDSGVDLASLAARTQGFSGADLASLLSEAAVLAARRGLEGIPAELVEEALDRSLIGVASRGTVLGPEERRLVAFHEAGHALVALALHGPGAVYKLTILPRGRALGHCSLAGGEERSVLTRTQLLDRMAVGLAGRVAEEMVGEPGSAAVDDLRRVGEMARQMAREQGMSPALGPLGYGPASDGWVPSEDARRLVEAEARRLAEEARDRARAVLDGDRNALDRVAMALLSQETLTATAVAQLAGAVPLVGRERVGGPAGREAASGRGHPAGSDQDAGPRPG